MSLTRLKQLMVEGTDDDLLQYLRQLGLGLGAPLVGVPFPFPVNQLPSDIFPDMKGMVFMKANGQSFDKESYPDCAIVYPTGTLPDLRGEFIRGLDDGRGVDPSRSILSSQSQSIQEHIHNTLIKTNGSPNLLPGNSYNVTLHGGARGELDDPSKTMRTTDIVGNPPNETRPRNIAFAYMIRIK